MAPGGKGLQRKRQPPAELPLTEYEKNTRVANVMRNNHRLQSLGISALASILNNSSAMSKPTGPANSGSLYEPGEDEDNEEGAVDKVSNDNVPMSNASMPSGGTRISKRVMAPNEQDQPTRVTRKRTRELSSTEELDLLGTSAATEDAMVAADCSIQHDDQIQNTNEGQPSDMISQFNRGRSMGKDLERITRGLSSKIPVLVAEGKRRPEAPMQAAKLASEGGIIFRQHMPILPHWKEYKKDKALLPNYISRIGGHFMMDTNNKAVAEACYDILKCVQRQTRYHLKKHYFDGVPANRVSTKSPLKHVTDEQWRALVAMWSDPKHKDRCTKNKENREKVQFHQRTGSRSYIAHCHAVKQEKYNGVDPNAIDLFKDCHFSNKVGYSEPVKKAIADMEAKLAEPTLEGQEPKSPTKVVSEVLPKTKFLQNIGLESAAPKRSAKAAVAARVQDLEAELESEKQGAAELRDKIDTQQHELDTLKKKVEEFDNLKKTSDETNALLRRLLSINKV